jgi:hypothetical protein
MMNANMVIVNRRPGTAAARIRSFVFSDVLGTV